jgi:hypothetical protein
MFVSAPTQTGAEQRRFTRKAVVWPGRVATEDGTLDCSVLNLSAGGARLRVVDALAPDAIVNLRIAGVGRFPARVVWRREHNVGVEFRMPPESVEAVISGPLTRGRTVH